MEIKKEIIKGVEVEYKGGDITLTAKVASFLIPEIEKIEAKVMSGEIDLIKGTDLDKDVMLKALSFIKEKLA